MAGQGPDRPQSETLPGVDQSLATVQDADFNTVHCSNWKSSYNLEIPPNWTTGVYLAKLTTSGVPS